MFQTQDEWIAGEAIADAVNYANQLREKFGQHKLVDLPPAVPSEPNNCVLAKAFNFDCEIRGWEAVREELTEEEKEIYGCDAWSVHFMPEKLTQAQTLFEVLGTKIEVSYKGHAQVLLPAAIGRIAKEFDGNNLPSKYYLDEEEVW